MGCFYGTISPPAHSPLKNDPFPSPPYLPLAISTLIRLDIVIPFLVTLTLFLITDFAHWRKHLLYGVGLFVLFMGSQTLLRYGYYGDVLPNTYYLKMTGYPL